VTKDERTKQADLMARKRAAARDIEIKLPANVQRRIDCLNDAELFLRTYFGDTFSQPFTDDRRAMLQSIIDAARFGGDFALAAPRGEGKSKIACYGSMYLMVAGLSNFPIVIGKSQVKAQNELKTIKERLQQTPLFIADFPEIGIPFEAVGGWSSRGRMQTVGGKNTNIEIGADHLIFPTITREQLRPDWPAECEPASCGQIMASLGVDGPIRGTNFRDRRPTLAILDDIENKKTSDSDAVIEANEQIIEKDVGGLGSGGRRVSRVMLCTVQNRKCIAFKYTDRKQKPSWNGQRYRKLVTPPSRMDLWDEYVQLRTNRGDEDPEARAAFAFYFDRQELMDEGAVISNPYSFDSRDASDGLPLELTAIQAYYNRVADFGKHAVATEDDNDPPIEAGPQGMGLTAEIVASRLSGLDRYQLPANATSLTAAIDLGKYSCHWVVTAWWPGGGGCVVDYGILEVTGTDNTKNEIQAIEPEIFKALLRWRDELLAKKYVDAGGAERKVDCVLVDSGTFTNAAYEFTRQVGAPFHCSKGFGNYRVRGKSTRTVLAGDHMHAAYQEAEKIWLFELDTDYWKAWMQERFMSPTFDENNMLRRGALSLFNPSGNRKHLSFSQHVVAEELVTEFKEGKGAKTYWKVHNENNHWGDALYNSCAAGRYTGVSLLADPSLPKATPREINADDAKKAKAQPAAKVQHGQRFKTRAGGWMQGLRRRG
jgi:hypothetical protein